MFAHADDEKHLVDAAVLQQQAGSTCKPLRSGLENTVPKMVLVPGDIMTVVRQRLQNVPNPSSKVLAGGWHCRCAGALPIVRLAFFSYAPPSRMPLVHMLLQIVQSASKDPRH